MRGEVAPRAEDRVPRWLAAGVLAVAFVLLCRWSWGKWADVQIDFGNELYLAWRLSEGDALYRDLAYRHGPLSHYWNALWFSLLGVSIRTLVWVNLAILAATCALLFRLFERSCGRLTATVTGLVFLSVFAFSQYVGIANYNYVAPYQHAQTHGLALSLAMIALLGGALASRSRWRPAAAGLCLGLVFLTKAELFVPAAAAAAVGLVLLRSGAAALVFLGAALVPVAAFAAFLAARMDPALALQGALGNWPWLGTGLAEDVFYRRGAGLDDPSGNALRAAGMAGLVAACAGVLVAADRLLPLGRRRAATEAIAGAALFAALAASPYAVPWARLPRALPLTTLAAVVWLAALCWRARGDRARLARQAPLLGFALLALGLLGKMLLNARIPHYGFVLAMPATLLLVAGFVHGLPEVARRWSSGRGAGGALARGLALAGVAAFALFFWRWSDRAYARKDFAVGSGADAIVAEGPAASPRPRAIARALERLGALSAPGETLLVLPEGASLNYWLRMRNPTRFWLLLPIEIASHGEEAILADLAAARPDWIALVHRDTREFGVGPFGVDARNGRGLVAWVRRHYERVETIGAEPFTGAGFGIALLRRAGPSAGDRSPESR